MEANPPLVAPPSGMHVTTNDVPSLTFRCSVERFWTLAWVHTFAQLPYVVLLAVAAGFVALSFTDVNFTSMTADRFVSQLAGSLFAGFAFLSIGCMAIAPFSMAITFGGTNYVVNGWLEGRNVKASEAVFSVMQNLGRYYLGGLLYLGAIVLGTLMCLLPGLAMAFFGILIFAFLVDTRLGAADAMRASFSAIQNNLGDALVNVLLAVGIGMIVHLGMSAAGMVLQYLFKDSPLIALGIQLAFLLLITMPLGFLVAIVISVMPPLLYQAIKQRSYALTSTPTATQVQQS